MNGYVAFYQGQTTEVYADTPLAARDKAHVEFQRDFPRKQVKITDVTVVLAEKSGEQVVHLPVF